MESIADKKKANCLRVAEWRKRAASQILIKQYQKKFAPAYRKKLRNEVIKLYSHGSMRCVCGAEIEHLHHKNPEHGLWEKKKFGSRTTDIARRHQIEIYTLIPDYIMPLCRQCHRKIHKQLQTGGKSV